MTHRARHSTFVFMMTAAFAVMMAGCRSSPGPTPPSEVVSRFYRTLLLLDISGAPSPTELAALAPYLSAELRVLLRKAREQSDLERARSPGEKPSFADGDLFSSLFEGPTTFEVIGDSAEEGFHRVPVRLTYAATPQAVTWTDYVIVKSESGRWVVADIQYGGDWDFALKGRLVDVLRGP